MNQKISVLDGKEFSNEQRRILFLQILSDGKKIKIVDNRSHLVDVVVPIDPIPSYAVSPTRQPGDIRFSARTKVKDFERFYLIIYRPGSREIGVITLDDIPAMDAADVRHPHEKLVMLQ